MREEKFPKVGVGVFVIRNGKVLMGKRKNAHGEGTWALIGGHLEFGESLEDCAKREVKEETGLDINRFKIGTLTSDVFKNEGKHYITVFMIAQESFGEPANTEPDKCEYLDWFDWDNLPEPLFLPLENLLKTNFNPFEG